MLLIEDRAKALGIFVAYTEVEDIKFGRSAGELETEIKMVEEKYKNENPEKLKENTIIRAYRDFYWKIGIDPTKTRPSGEALRRRISRNGSIPRINNIVDIGNLVSADTLVPIGIYDKARFQYPIYLKLSSGGELFYAIGRSEPEKIDPNIPILVDSKGVVMHIYPHRDSTLTNVIETTKDVLIVSAGVKGVNEDLVILASKRTAELLVKYANGKWNGDVKLA
ncbi:B3/4 domain-containing protein [Sulfolobus acidocaldarius]|uniref:Conserved Archaeal protein n=4 Tax=Sulfolobus acidocaldarius TaxID=2285 RepID=Q4J8D0_SULAC|nr:phenylalanine--tRNA ligase beta subunit-related protein [Sulfolobus acidocaldarius]AAY80948.1 conserved Archaeal protein [Sulfolobus acidocaldarius DSM 639]AGE71549.1 hypothetical protein SacN8_07945 [Sulfolobus acidocaldarius N8]AGE73822.1 hypothetical protein SacRon12I_07955 [Sulfolobus acidocaldarius Ron12/I]ALU30224.1 hypothetical protein ATY89_09930 [Sulfolobus acidocaldarius]ALU30939.1 hypothetical protein ATZ20_01485 [Sulfolobus acidocaldarius]